MSQPVPPVPRPRRLRGPVKSVDDEMLKCGSQTSCSEMNLKQRRSSTPPLVMPRTWVSQEDTVENEYAEILTMDKPSVTKKVEVRPPPLPAKPPKMQLSGITETPKQRRSSTPPPMLPRRTWVRQDAVENEYVEILTMDKPSVTEKVEVQHPPPPPARPLKMQLSGITETLEVASLSDSYGTMIPWTDVCRDLQLRGEPEAVVINIKAELLYKAIQEYNQLMCEHGGKLKDLINELQSIALNLDKVSKGTKIAGITGGASTVAGGVAAAAGVILSPFTAGASLALTVVGVGVAAAGGVTGASAAIAHKANLTQDKKKIDKTLQDFDDCYEKILSRLKYINEGMDQLKQHGLSVLNATESFSLTAEKVVKLVTGDTSAVSSETSNKASGVIKGFALGMDFYFVEGKDGLKVKKGLESKLAKKLRKLAEDLDKGLNELMDIKDVFSKLD